MCEHWHASGFASDRGRNSPQPWWQGSGSVTAPIWLLHRGPCSASPESGPQPGAHISGPWVQHVHSEMCCLPTRGKLRAEPRAHLALAAWESCPPAERKGINQRWWLFSSDKCWVSCSLLCIQLSCLVALRFVCLKCPRAVRGEVTCTSWGLHCRRHGS